MAGPDLTRRAATSAMYPEGLPSGGALKFGAMCQILECCNQGWRGVRAGSAPEPSAVAAALQGHQLFVYLGHGGGEQYIGVPCCQSGALLPVGRQAAMCAPTHFGTVRRSGTNNGGPPPLCANSCAQHGTLLRSQ